MNDSTDETQPNGASASRFVLVGILLLAGLLRLYRLDLIGVTNETAYQELTATTAMSMEDGEWPLAGPPTEEVRSSAFLVTAIAIANLISWNPHSGIVFVIGLNLFAILLLYRMCAKQFGLQVAVIATLLAAVSPWGVLYSRSLLSSSCLAFFSVLLIHLSLRWREEKGKQQLFMLAVLSCLIPQIHFSGMWVPLWTIAVLFLVRKQISYVSLIAGGLVGAILWFPWIKFQRIGNWEELTNWIGQIIQAPREHGAALLQSLDHFQSMLHASGFGYWFGGSRSDWLDYFPAWMNWGLGISAICLAGSLIYSVVMIVVRRTDRRLLLLLLWIALPMLFGGLLRTGVRPENLLIAYPIPFVLIALSLVQIARVISPKVRFVPLAAVCAICLLNVYYLSCLERFVNDRRTTIEGNYGLSYNQRRATIKSILERTGTDPVRIVGPYSGWYPAYEYVLMFELNGQAGAREQPIDQQLFFWIDEQPPSETRNENAWRIQKERQINLSIAEYLLTPPNWIIEEHWTVETAQIYRLKFKLKKAFQ